MFYRGPVRRHRRHELERRESPVDPHRRAPRRAPAWALYGTDGEKAVWTPGIYDRVSLLLADSPIIETIQVAPRIQNVDDPRRDAAAEPRAGPGGRDFAALEDVEGRPGGRPARAQEVALAAGEEKTLTQSVPVPGAVLWSPENPFLYVLDTSSGGDSCSTRFGMREFRFSTANRRAMLNGKVIYLRGASITLHRFFGDPQCGGLPWNAAWVRRFLVEIPKQMHWNAFRVCIGPAPQQWLDVADEAGILLQYEFPIWSDRAVPPRRLVSPYAVEGKRRRRAGPRIHARQLEPSERGPLGRLERNALGLSQGQVDSRGARPGSFPSALGERLQFAARAGRSLRVAPVQVHRPLVGANRLALTCATWRR